tara:strand:- start:609 stop:764 length:156 start_codon:yes stop_codon:yes gene_type:complete
MTPLQAHAMHLETILTLAKFRMLSKEQCLEMARFSEKLMNEAIAKQSKETK